MATETITVNPSGEPNAIKVALDFYNGVFFPLYKIAFSVDGEEPVQVSKEDPMPVALYDDKGNHIGTPEAPILVEHTDRMKTRDSMEVVMNELSLIRTHLQIMTGENLKLNDIEKV